MWLLKAAEDWDGPTLLLLVAVTLLGTKYFLMVVDVEGGCRESNSSKLKLILKGSKKIFHASYDHGLMYARNVLASIIS